jgi:hypothetical protein
MRAIRLSLVLTGVLILSGCGSAEAAMTPAQHRAGAALEARAVAGPVKGPSQAPAPAKIPTPDQMAIEVKVVEKKCFGSAGCVLTYTLKPTYTGADSDLSGTSFTVVYEVLGGEEPRIGRLRVVNKEILGGISEETIETKRSSDVLSAKVTEIF